MAVEMAEVLPHPAPNRLSGPALVYVTTALALVLAVTLLVTFGWRDRARSYEEAGEVAANVADVLAEHTARVVEIGDLVLRQAVAQTDTPSGIIPSSRLAWNRLRQLVAASPHVLAIWLTDPAGNVVLTSREHPAPRLSFAERDYFRVQRGGTDSLFISGGPEDRLDGGPPLLLSRRLTAGDGSFRGVATIAVSGQPLRDFYRSLDFGFPPVVELFKRDRSIVMREPEPAAGQSPTIKPEVFDAYLGGGVSGVIVTDGADEMLHAFQRIGPFDLYVDVGVATADIDARTREQLLPYFYYGAVGLLALLGLGYLALVRARHETAARAALTRARHELEQRVADRTAALTDANARLETALGEKDMLLREVNHRVKNSLQLISSLLRLHAGEVRDGQARQSLAEAQSRVMAVAQIHERLYQTDRFATVEFGSYLGRLTQDLTHSFQANGHRADIRVSADKAELPPDRAVPLALIVNELVTNAVKYAYPGQPAGAVEIGFKVDGADGYRLTVADHGIGLPPGFDHAQSSRLGMKLVRTLAGQLGATLEVESGAAGARFAVVKPASAQGSASVAQASLPH